MADIALGASVVGALTNSDQKNAYGNFYDEYNIKLTDNRAVRFALEFPIGAPDMYLNVINVATGERYDMFDNPLSISLQAGDYKLKIFSSTLGVADKSQNPCTEGDISCKKLL